MLHRLTHTHVAASLPAGELGLCVSRFRKQVTGAAYRPFPDSRSYALTPGQAVIVGAMATPEAAMAFLRSPAANAEDVTILLRRHVRDLRQSE